MQRQNLCNTANPCTAIAECQDAMFVHVLHICMYAYTYTYMHICIQRRNPCNTANPCTAIAECQDAMFVHVLHICMYAYTYTLTHTYTETEPMQHGQSLYGHSRVSGCSVFLSRSHSDLCVSRGIYWRRPEHHGKGML